MPLMAVNKFTSATDVPVRSPFLYFVNAAAPSLTIANEIRVSVGLAPQ